MTASNHTLTGIVLATAIHNPALAWPAALISHFILDTFPHYRYPINRPKVFNRILVSDGVISISLVVSVFWLLPFSEALIAAAGGILAASPDAMWIKPYFDRTHGKQEHFGPLTRFHKWIQWGERPWGIIVDGLWFGLMLVALSRLV